MFMFDWALDAGGRVAPDGAVVKAQQSLRRL